MAEEFLGRAGLVREVARIKGERWDQKLDTEEERVEKYCVAFTD